MYSLQQFVKRNPKLFTTVLYLLVCILAFGLFIPFLGFYWDDWPTIFYTYNQRVGQLINHFSYDRPFSVWAYWLVGRLGSAPITWHLAALLIRWGCVVAAAWALKPLWPRQAKFILYIGLIFAIYPGYYVQPSSVIFIPHLAALGLFLVSLGAMGRSVVDSKQRVAYTVLALTSAAIHMFTVEYYVGLELIRPIYLWLLLKNQQPTKKTSLKETFGLWFPYLIIFGLWLAWRLFFLKLPSEPYPLVLISDLRSNPLSAILNLGQTILQDLVYTLGTAWSELIQPSLFTLATRFDLLIWAIVLASGVGIYYLLSQIPRLDKGKTETANSKSAQQGMLFGLGAFLLGMFPIWAIGETIAQGDYNLRYILISMFGASVFLVSLLFYFVNGQRQRILIISLLVALAIGSHLRAANDYRLDWQAQRAFYWQLAWRAPAIESGTALVAFAPVSTHLRDPMTGNALNVLYPTAEEPPAVGLWNFELTRTKTVERIQQGEPLENDYRGLTFSTQSPDDLVFYYLPDGGCLWALTPLDVDNQYLPFENRDLVAHSNLDNILAWPAAEGGPPRQVFGSEPEHSWCYYFEKADLARQQGEWDAVISLMEEAKGKGLSPNYGIEWLPLVQAFAATGNWEQALATSELVHAMGARNDGMLCAVWAAFADPAPEAYAQLVELAGCATQ